MIDLHCHLDLYPDALNLLPEVGRKNLFTLVVTTSPRAWQATSRVFAGYDNIKVGLGLHPEIAERKANERLLLVSLIKQAKFVGEIGLDGSPRFRSSLSLQESILSDVFAECEQQGGRIMSLHSRGAVSKVLDLLEKYPRAGKPILHWFSGNTKELCRAIELGCWFSVGPAMLTNAKGCDLLRGMPINSVLPETDGPFATLASVPLMPWEAINIVCVLEKLWSLSSHEVTLQMQKNLATLLDRKL